MTAQHPAAPETEMPLADLMRDYRDGDERGWQNEFDWLDANHAGRMDMLTTSIQERGITEPILLGNDGRVWDGHHRIAVAHRLGLESVPVRLAPAAPETETDANGLRELLAAATPGPWKSRLGNVEHYFPHIGEFGVIASPADSADARLIVAAVNALPALLADLDAARERVRVVEGERDRLRRWKDEALPVIDGLQELGDALELPLGERITGPAAVEAARALIARAESAEAAHEAEKAAHERLRGEFDELADDFASNVDWSAGRGNYGDNQAWESAARQVRTLLGGGEAR